MSDLEDKYNLSKILFQYFKENSIWVDELIAEYNLSNDQKDDFLIGVQISSKIHYGVNTISGFLTEEHLSLQNIWNLCKEHNLNDISLSLVSQSLSVLLSKRIERLPEHYPVRGYFIYSSNFLKPEEFNIEPKDDVKYLKAISKMKQEIAEYKERFIESENQIIFLGKQISDQNDILAGRATLSWS
jgi:hypothetical protein